MKASITEALKKIGNTLIARGADRKLVLGIVSDRRLQPHENALLMDDIFHKIAVR